MPALVCTACGAPLPAEGAGTTITCPFEHGTWFDRTELLAFMDRETHRRRM